MAQGVGMVSRPQKNTCAVQYIQCKRAPTPEKTTTARTTLMRATALLWGNNRDIDAAAFSECVPSNDDRRQAGGRLCPHQGTPHKE